MPVADTIHIKPTEDSPDHWDVWVTYTYFGIFPAPSKYFGCNLTKKQVEELQVPFAKFCIYDKDCPFPQRVN